MHFVVVVSAGNPGGFFFSRVSDLCVLISASAFATHGACENTVPGIAVLTFLQEQLQHKNSFHLFLHRQWSHI